MEIIMLNTNVYGRPYDDITQKRILEEAIASVKIFSLAILGSVIVKASDVLFAELSLIKDKPKREMVVLLVRQISKGSIKLNEPIIRVADKLHNLTNDYMDALHIASAALGGCSYFLTCDDELTLNAPQIERLLIGEGFNIQIKNPLKFIRELGGLL